MTSPSAVVLLGATLPPPAWPLHDMPPALAPIANRPVIVHQLEALRQAGVERTVVAGSSAAAERARTLLASASLAPEAIPYYALEAVGDDVEPTMAAVRSVGRSPLVLVESATLVGDDVEQLVAQVQDDPLRAIVVAFAPGVRSGAHPRIAAIVVGAEALAALAPIDPAATLQTASLPNALRRHGARVVTQAAGGSWRTIERAEDLLDANRACLDAIAAGPPEAFASGPGLHGAVIVDPTATVDYATVRGPAIIGARAYLADSYIGPYTAVGEDATIEDAEVEGSVVCAGAVVRQLRVRLLDSLIGARALVTEEPRTPRALRLGVGEDAQISLP